MRVDPRGRGGAGNVAASAGVNPGRSPRARGSPRGVVIPDVDIGSIPAGAGEPSPTAAAPAPTRVDPRGRGGAHPAAPVRGGDRGRSPRARGSLRHAPGLQVRHGSIPAGAGEPRYRASRSTGNWVDPRGRGGADEVFVGIVLTAGRSPRARGSHGPPAPDPRRLGVDPRGRGGAISFVIRNERLRGRSPRARGSREPLPGGQGRVGSIPAGAGEPEKEPGTVITVRVDPRGRGGAREGTRHGHHGEGRSPRARGSRLIVTPCRFVVGSIPAGAGEPAMRAARARQYRVDPRGRGGAGQGGNGRADQQGRSPRARGSLHRAGGARERAGSIPAGAGEPRRPRAPPRCRRVDPRGRGGAPACRSSPIRSRGRSPRARGSHCRNRYQRSR